MSKINKENRMDILLVTDNGLDTVGGEQESTKIIIDGIRGNYSLGVIQPGNISKPLAGVHYYPLTEQTRIKHLFKNPFSFLKYIWKIKRIINKERPKIIHTQAQVSFFIISLLKKTRLIRSDFSFIHTERGLYIRYSNFFKVLFHSLIKELNMLITTTEFNMSFWQNALKSYKDIDYKIIENTAGEIFETYNDKLKNKDDKLVVGFAGRYSEQKDWPLAIEICNQLNQELNEEFKVVMAVGCLDKKSFKETQQMFENMTEMLGSKFTGLINIDLNEMNKFYYNTDIFIMTSKPNSESFGRTIVEAMSRYNIVLTTDAGGPVEIIPNKENICNNSEQFFDRIIKYHSNKNYMEQEKEFNYKNVRKSYSLQNNINKHKVLYKDILTEK